MKGINLLLILLLFIAPANPAIASMSSVALEIPYQVQNADRIIIGTVVDIHRSNFHTAVTIQADEWLMNPLPAKTITIQTEGGANLWVEDQASFYAGETVLLMIEDVDLHENRFTVLWGIAGKHPVSVRDEVMRAISQKERFDDQKDQASEVFTGEIVKVAAIPEEWDIDLDNFNYAVISVGELEYRPDTFITISEPDRYPYLEQAIANLHQESGGGHGQVEFHSFDDTDLDEMLDNRNTSFIEVNNNYYDVNFLAQDPMAPISYHFNNYFELNVKNVVKSSTNLTSNSRVKILYSDSLKYNHVRKGQRVKVWVEAVDKGPLNLTFNETLYKASSEMEGYDIELLDSSGNNPPSLTDEIPFIGIIWIFIVLAVAVFLDRMRR